MLVFQLQTVVLDYIQCQHTLIALLENKCCSIRVYPLTAMTLSYQSGDLSPLCSFILHPWL